MSTFMHQVVELGGQIFYGETLERMIRAMEPDMPVLSGDFNCILGNIDAANNPKQKSVLPLVSW